MHLKQEMHYSKEFETSASRLMGNGERTENMEKKLAVPTYISQLPALFLSPFAFLFSPINFSGLLKFSV